MRELPPGWDVAAIGDLCTLVNGKAFKPSDWSDAGLPIVRIKNLNDPGASFNHYSGELPEKFLVHNGDLLFAWSGTPGTSFGAHIWLGGDAALNQHIFNMRFPGSCLDKHYVRFAINQELKHLIEQAHGGVGLRHVTKGKFESTTIPVPPLAEQRRIVAKLDRLFARTRRAREELSRIPRLIEHYKQAILAAAFRGATETAERMATLGELASEVRNGLSKKPADAPPGAPILRISAVRPLVVNLLDRRYYPPGEEVSERAILANGDLLFTRYNGNPEFVAVCGKVRDLSETVTYPDKLIRVRLVQDVVPSFVELLCSAAQARDALRPFIKTAAGQHGISGKDLKKLQIPVPNPRVQRAIDEATRSQLSAIAGLANKYRSAMRLVDHLDQANLAKAFRGELVPQDPSDEPAAVLLERTRAARAAEPKPKRRRGKAAAG